MHKNYTNSMKRYKAKKNFLAQLKTKNKRKKIGDSLPWKKQDKMVMTPHSKK